MKPHKRLERYLSALFSLGRLKGMAKEATRNLDALRPRTDHLEQRASQHDEELRAMQKSLDTCFARLEERVEEQKLPKNLAETLIADYRRERDILKHTGQSDTALLARMFSDLSRRLDNIGAKPTPPATASADPAQLPTSEGFDLFKETFYHRLENRYRGAPEEIAKRLKVYLPDVEAAWLRTGKKPAMDIGCGRGEWLALMSESGIEAFGIDTNAVQIEEAKDRGFDVRVGDALQALSDMEDNSLSVLTAHHLIEHLPFDAVAWITREALRVLAPGGLLLFETPNTRNVLVGATTFHTDPTHLKPMPEQVMSVLLETAGFDPVDTYGLNPHERFNEFLSKPDFNDELAFLMFGPQDLAILGIKPREA
jgi:SAM-dependent methyltransferase